MLYCALAWSCPCYYYCDKQRRLVINVVYSFAYYCIMLNNVTHSLTDNDDDDDVD